MNRSKDPTQARPKWIEPSSAETPVRQALAAGLERRLRAVTKNLRLAAENPGQNVADIHGTRTSSRRAAAAIKTFASLLPKRERSWMKRELKKIREAASGARDDDVLLERLTQRGADPSILVIIAKHRKRSQRPVKRVYLRLIEEGRFERRAHELIESVRKRKRDHDVSFGSWAPRRLRKSIDRFRDAEAQDLHDLDALHWFRIRSKEVRYSIELLASAFPEDAWETPYEAVTALQETLGEVNDHASAIVRIEGWLDDDIDAGLEAVLRDLLREEREALATSREVFHAWWTPERSRDLQQRLESMLAEARDVSSSSRPLENSADV